MDESSVGRAADSQLLCGFEADAVNSKVDGSSPKKGIIVLSDESGGAKNSTGVLEPNCPYGLYGYQGIFFSDPAKEDYIQVKKEWISKGVSHRLLEECLNWARKKDARIIHTETGRDNETAVRLYQRHGLQITGHIPDYYREGLDAVFLTNKLL